MKKKIIFFDGDGTLWYPRRTRHRKHPVWIYRDKRVKDHNKHLILTPSAITTIKKLKGKEITTVILSTNSYPPKEAMTIMRHKIKYFKLEDLFDEVYATRKYPESKGVFILRILKKRKIPKSKALMVGDSYVWDYKPARDVGIDALIIKTPYEHVKVPRKYTIEKLHDLIGYLTKKE